MNYDNVKNLIALGFNIIALNDDKTPKKAWKEFQDKPVYSCVESNYYGLITGYNDVECVDIDLKVLPSKQERDLFMKNLINDIDNHIEDYKKKLVIKKTRSGGYHLIYKAKNIEGNQKLAKLKGIKEAIIETRGIGGYICIYEQIINLDYSQIQYITDEERDIIISICKIYTVK
jgi:hypothetical protein